MCRDNLQPPINWHAGISDSAVEQGLYDIVRARRRCSIRSVRKKGGGRPRGPETEKRWNDRRGWKNERGRRCKRVVGSVRWGFGAERARVSERVRVLGAIRDGGEASVYGVYVRWRYRWARGARWEGGCPADTDSDSEQWLSLLSFVLAESSTVGPDARNSFGARCDTRFALEVLFPPVAGHSGRGIHVCPVQCVNECERDQQVTRRFKLSGVSSATRRWIPWHGAGSSAT